MKQKAVFPKSSVGRILHEKCFTKNVLTMSDFSSQNKCPIGEVLILLTNEINVLIVAA